MIRKNATGLKPQERRLSKSVLFDSRLSCSDYIIKYSDKQRFLKYRMQKTKYENSMARLWSFIKGKPLVPVPYFLFSAFICCLPSENCDYQKVHFLIIAE